MKIEYFFRNLKYLFMFSLKGIYSRANADYEEQLILRLFEMYKNLEEIREIKGQYKIMTATETLDYLNNSNVSLCRFGDSELDVMFAHKDTVFQKYDKNLAKRLEEILCSKDSGLLIGINNFWFNDPSQIVDNQKMFYLTHASIYRNMMKSCLDKNVAYGDSAFTFPYMLYKSMDFDSYYKKFEQLWKDKDIVLIIGKGIFDKIQKNIFSSAKSIEYIYGANVDAFDGYEELFSKASATDKNKIKFIIMGQTATVLAYDLFKLGHRALDLGHIAKDYNAYYHQSCNDRNGSIKFFDKD